MSGPGLPVPDAASRATAPAWRREPLLLVADLDTLVRGSGEDTALLAERLCQRPHTSVVYVAPHRSHKAVQVCVEVFHLPPAQVVVTDRGASIRPAQQHDALTRLDARIGSQWPGTGEIRRRIRALDHLLIEHASEDSRRLTYFPRRGVSVTDAHFAIVKVLADLDVDVSVTDGQQIDVLPDGTDLTFSVLHTLRLLEPDPSSVVVAGEFVEPRIVDDGEYWGILTGDTPTRTRQTLAHHPRVHVTDLEGPGGVLDGLHALRFL